MTLTERRAEQVAALEAADIPAAVTLGKRTPPYVAVIGESIELAHIVRGQALASFRWAMIAGAWDDEAAVAMLDALKLGCIAVARALEGYAVGDVRRDGIRRIAGGEYLAADLIVSAYVTI